MHVNPDSTICRLTRPALNLASLVFKTVSLIHLAIKTIKKRGFPDMFIISVDNLSFGGTGKTPLTIAIGQALEKRAVPFAIVLRGYRSGHEKKGTLVESHHRVAEIGDESFLLKKRFPKRDILIGRDRLSSIAMAARRKNRIVILDDGLQTTQVKKDFSIMLINPGHPYFYLRNFKFFRHRENLVLYYRPHGTRGDEVSADTYGFALDGFRDAHNREVEIGHAKIVAFSALGDNARFENDMRQFHLAAFRGFSDHHSFNAGDIQALESLRKENEATWIVCTEKDYYKINQFLSEATPLLYVRNKIELPGDAIEQIIKHAAQKGFI